MVSIKQSDKQSAMNSAMQSDKRPMNEPPEKPAPRVAAFQPEETLVIHYQTPTGVVETYEHRFSTLEKIRLPHSIDSSNGSSGAETAWFDHKTGQVIPIQNPGRQVKPSNLDGLTEEKLPGWLKEIRADFDSHFIGSNRLLQTRQPDRESLQAGGSKSWLTVVLDALELAHTVQTTLAKSAALSQELDRTFPSRLVQRMLTQDLASLPTDAEIDERLEKLEERRRKLESVGLINTAVPSPVHLDEDTDAPTRKVLSLYIEDTTEKLAVFDDLERRINLFLDIVNRRLHHKRITVDRHHGFLVVLSDGSELSLEKLSSGEQHLMATHSPDIIGDHWDLTVSLEEAAE